MVHKVAVAFKETRRVFGSKAVWTGCPCNNQHLSKEIPALKAQLGLKQDSKVVVLLGGSQGSKFLNDAFFNTMKLLLKSDAIEAVHVTGKNDFLLYQEKYKAAQLPVIVSAFMSPIEDVYAVADVIVSRSGAATVSELGFFGNPSVLIPYPYAHGHQAHNARILVQAGSATLIEQKDLTADVLLEAIQKYFKNPVSKEVLRQKNAPFFVSDSVVQLANSVESL